MKVVKWGVHGTGTCIGPGILLGLSEIANHTGVTVQQCLGHMTMKFTEYS